MPAQRRVACLLLVAFVAVVHGDVLPANYIYRSGLETTWELAQNPWVVNGKLTVDLGATLTIARGVRVHFAAGASIEVRGVLRVEGHPLQRVVFTTTSATPAAGQWKHVFFTSQATGYNATSGEGSVVRHATFEYGGSDRGMLLLGGHAPDVVDVTFTDSSQAGVYVDSTASSLLLDGVSVTKSRIGLQSASSSNTALCKAPYVCLVKNSEFSGNSQQGVYFRSDVRSNAITFQNVRVVDNNHRGFDLLYITVYCKGGEVARNAREGVYSYINSLELADMKVHTTASTYSTIYYEYDNVPGGFFRLRNSTLADSRRGLVVANPGYSYTGYQRELVVSDSTFKNLGPDYSAMQVCLPQDGADSKIVELRGNTVTGCNSGTAPVINMYHCYTNSEPAVAVSITGNTIVRNTIRRPGSAVVRYASIKRPPQPALIEANLIALNRYDLTSTDELRPAAALLVQLGQWEGEVIHVKENSIFNPLLDAELVVNSSATLFTTSHENSVVATRNYWGPLRSDLTAVRSLVLDATKSIAQPLAKVAPFLTEPADICVSAAPSLAELTSDIPINAPAPVVSFPFTGEVQQYKVPNGVTRLLALCWGAGGAGGYGNSQQGWAQGGAGGFARGIIPVTAGETLDIYVGGAGQPRAVGSKGGWNGGGDGSLWQSVNSRAGAGGGGRSDIRRGQTPLIVAGGGGGGAFRNNYACCAPHGGPGGGPSGADGAPSTTNPDVPTQIYALGGGGATPLRPGLGGRIFDHSYQAVNGTNGFLNEGGAGPEIASNRYSSGGGGGGGGFYGGGSGGITNNGAGSGGGGGNGYTDPSVSEALLLPTEFPSDPSAYSIVPPQHDHDLIPPGTFGYGGVSDKAGGDGYITLVPLPEDDTSGTQVLRRRRDGQLRETPLAREHKARAARSTSTSTRKPELTLHLLPEPALVKVSGKYSCTQINDVMVDVPPSAVAILATANTYTPNRDDHILWTLGRNNKHSCEALDVTPYLTDTPYNDVIITHSGNSAGRDYYGRNHPSKIIPVKQNPPRLDLMLIYADNANEHFLTLTVYGYLTGHGTILPSSDVKFRTVYGINDANKQLADVMPPNLPPNTTAAAVLASLGTYDTSRNDHWVVTLGRNNANMNALYGDVGVEATASHNDVALINNGDNAGRDYYGVMHGSHVVPVDDNNKWQVAANVGKNSASYTGYLGAGVFGFVPRGPDAVTNFKFLPADQVEMLRWDVSQTAEVKKGITLPSAIPTGSLAVIANVFTYSPTNYADHMVHTFGRHATHDSFVWDKRIYDVNTPFNDVVINHNGDSADRDYYGYAHGTVIVPLHSDGTFDAMLGAGKNAGTSAYVHKIRMQIIGYIAPPAAVSCTTPAIDTTLPTGSGPLATAAGATAGIAEPTPVSLERVLVSAVVSANDDPLLVQLSPTAYGEDDPAGTSSYTLVFGDNNNAAINLYSGNAEDALKAAAGAPDAPATLLDSTAAGVTEYLPEGVQYDVPAASVAAGGWSECWSETYATAGTTLDAIFSVCTKANLMLACRNTATSDTYSVLAWAPSDDVTLVTGSDNSLHVSNGVQWYWDMDASIGFAPLRTTITRTGKNCDEATGPGRVCWPTSAGKVLSGLRCGTDTPTNDDTFERVLLHAGPAKRLPPTPSGLVPLTGTPATFWLSLLANELQVGLGSVVGENTVMQHRFAPADGSATTSASQHIQFLSATFASALNNQNNPATPAAGASAKLCALPIEKRVLDAPITTTQPVGKRTVTMALTDSGMHSLLLPRWAVQSPCATVEIKAWGAAGGSGNSPDNSPDQERTSGAGGYARATSLVRGRELLEVAVGQGGGARGAGGWPAGGNGGRFYNVDTGGGGGRSQAWWSESGAEDPILVAGGGGGGSAGGRPSDTQSNNDGGGGGGTNGQDSVYTKGGTQYAGGVPTTFSGNYNEGQHFAGGWSQASGTYYQAAGGGDGWYGGGTGGYYAAAGAGGSGYISPYATGDRALLQSNWDVPAGLDDPDYPGEPVAYGVRSDDRDGNDGAVILTLRENDPTNTCTIASPAAHWRLDDGHDTTAYELIHPDTNSGKLVNMDPASSWITLLGTEGLKFGHALRFNGRPSPREEYIAVPNASTLALTTDFSVAFWVYPTGGHETLDAPSINSTEGFLGSHRFVINEGPERTENGSSTAALAVSVATNGISVFAYGGPDLFTPLLVLDDLIEGWTSIIVTVSDNQPSLFVNGSLALTGLQADRELLLAPDRLGGSVHGGYMGLLDDVQFFSHVVDSSGVAGLYLGGREEPSPAIDACSSFLSVELEHTSFFLDDQGNRIGGLVQHFVRIPYRQEPYLVDADVLVSSGAQLIVEPGVQLLVRPGVSFHVFGKVLMLGEQSRPITVSAAPLPDEDSHRLMTATGEQICVSDAGDPDEHLRESYNYFDMTMANYPEPVDACVNTCKQLGFVVAGVKRTYSSSPYMRCWCGNEFGQYGTLDVASGCSFKCGTKQCGGNSGRSIYSTGGRPVWGTLKFATTSDGSVLRHVTLTGAGMVGGRDVVPAVWVEGPHVPAMEHVTIDNVRGDGLRIDGLVDHVEPLVLKHLTVTRTADIGVHLVRADRSCYRGCTLDNVVVDATGAEGIRVYSGQTRALLGPVSMANVSVSNCSLRTSVDVPDRWFAVYLRELRGQPTTLEDVVIADNFQEGAVYGYSLRLSLHRTRVLRSGRPGSFAISLDETDTDHLIAIEDSVFEGNTGVLFSRGRYWSRQGMLIRGCVFKNNAKGKRMIEFAPREVSGIDERQYTYPYNKEFFFRFENNQVENNQVEGTGDAVRGLGPVLIRVSTKWTSAFTADNGGQYSRLLNNTFVNNVVRRTDVAEDAPNAHDGSLVWWLSTPSRYSLDSIEGNTIENNTVGSTLILGDHVSFSSDVNRIRVNRNTFLNYINATAEPPVRSIELDVRLPSAGVPVDATNNFWGADTVPGVHALVHDALEDTLVEAATISPFVGASVQNASAGQRDWFVDPVDGTVGGLVVGEHSIPAGEHRVKNNILVTDDGHLIIEPGARLVLDPQVSVEVRGKITAVGTAQQPVEFLPAPQPEWSDADMDAVVAYGCYSDNTYTRDRRNQGHAYFNMPNMTVNSCLAYCRSQRYQYAALKRGLHCFCSPDANLNYKQSETYCNGPCPGDSSQKCGRSDRTEVLVFHDPVTVPRWHQVSLTPFSGASVLKHVKLVFGGVQQHASALEVNTTAATLEHIDVTHSGGNGILFAAPTAPGSDGASNSAGPPFALAGLSVSDSFKHGLQFRGHSCRLGCSLTNVRVTDNFLSGIDLVRDSVTASYGPVSIKDSVVEGNLRESEVDRASGYVAGIFMQRVNSALETPSTLQNVTFRNNRFGLAFRMAEAYFTVTNCLFVGNGVAATDFAVYSDDMPADRQTVIQDSEFGHNVGGAIWQRGRYWSRSALVVQRCHIHGHLTAVRLVELYPREVSGTDERQYIYAYNKEYFVRFEDNVVENNALQGTGDAKINTGAVLLRISLKWEGSYNNDKTLQGGYVLRNQFINNTLTRTDVATTDPDYYTAPLVYWLSSASVYTDDTIMYNTFRNNVAGISVMLGNHNNGNSAVLRRLLVRYNAFANPQTPTQLATTMVSAALSFDATYNYWGTNIEFTVMELIQDQLDSPNVELIEYFPYLTTAAVEDGARTVVDLNATRTTFTPPDGTIRGRVLGTANVLPAGEYNVTGNLVIARGAVLTLKPGVIFNIAPGMGFGINGKLVSVGTEASPVVFRAQSQAGSPPLLNPLQYEGCYSESSTLTTTSNNYDGHGWRSMPGLTIEKCVQYCHGERYQYAALYAGAHCYCGDQIRGSLQDERYGKQPCTGNATQWCGDGSRARVYRTGATGRWGQMLVGPDALGTVFSHTKFAWGGSGTETDRHRHTVVLELPIPLDHVSVTHSGGHGVQYTIAQADIPAQPLRVSNGEFSYNFYRGLSFEADACTAGCVLTSVKATGNLETGIYIGTQRNGQAIVLDNVHASGSRGAFRDVYSSSSHEIESGVRINCGSDTDREVRIESSSFSNNAGHGLETRYCTLDVTSSIFANNGDGNDEYGWQAFDVYDGVVQRSTFKNNVCGLYANNVREFHVIDNEFVQNGNEGMGSYAVYLAVYYYYQGNVNMLVKDNRFFNNTASNAALYAYLQNRYTVPSNVRQKIQVVDNDFTSNRRGAATVVWDMTDHQGPKSDEDYVFSGNALFGNVLDDPLSSVLDVRVDVANTGASPYITYNLFSNPDQLYDLTAGSCPACTVQAPQNYFGHSDLTLIGKRIKEYEDLSTLTRIIWRPPLLDAEFECTTRNNCSDRGHCSRPERCSCNSGWTGDNCTEFTCEDVFDCNSARNAGTCVGNNTCSCGALWQPPFCKQPICTGGCNFGTCAGPDQCECFFGYEGKFCNASICHDDEYLIPETPTTKRECRRYTLCTEYQFEVSGPQPTADRVCQNLTVCEGNFEQDRAPTTTKDRTCKCVSGWTGAKCDAFTCKDVFSCNVGKGGGVCTGPNTCQCTQGQWEGPGCSVPVCPSGCGSHGRCTSPDKCTCDSGWAGDTCDQCAPLFAGALCNKKCPSCVNGACSEGLTGTGLCVCQPRWRGERCDTCEEGLFGPACLPVPGTDRLLPASALDTGGELVTVYGFNFGNGSLAFTCTFGSSAHIPATVLTDTKMTCKVPVSPDEVVGSQSVTVRVYDAQGQQLPGKTLTLQYVALCPDTACNNGVCSRGACKCNFGWRGDDCLVEIIPVAFPTTMTLSPAVEGLSYTSAPLQVAQGSRPIQWRITSSPQGMVIDAVSGELTWAAPVASTSAYSVRVEAKNERNSVARYVYLTVQPAYRVSLAITQVDGVDVTQDMLDDGLVVKTGGFVRLVGQVVPLYDGASLASRPVTVLIKRFSDAAGTKVSTTTLNLNSFSNGVWQTYYQLGQYTGGHHRLYAQHPKDPSDVVQGRFATHAIRTVSDATVKGVPGVVDGFGLVGNQGDTQITGLAVTVDPTIRSQLLTQGISILSLSVPSEIGAFEQARVNVTLDVTVLYFRASFYVQVSCNEATSVSVRVNLNVAPLQPKLLTSPGSISATVLRGAQTLFSYEVRNVGAAQTGDLSVLTPSNAWISLVSQDTIPSLQVGNTTVVTFSVTVPSDAPLGWLSGSFAVTNSLVGVGLSYSLLVESNVTGSMVVYPEDEFTYYVDERPLVSGAIVTVTSADRRFRFRVTAPAGNYSEPIRFPDLQEQHYTVNVQASGHGSFTNTFYVKDGEVVVKAFLPKQVVSYTWTVRQTTVQETYKFTLEATFQTQVPAPVITIEPTVVNLDELESGAVDTFTYEITNHGLIRADNVALKLPSSHPFLTFTHDEPIGAVEANSTILVPVRVTGANLRRNRRASGGCHVGVGTYSYECGGTRYGAVGLTYSGGAPCSGGGGPGGGGGLVIGPYTGGGTGPGVRSSFSSPSFATFDYCDPCTKAVVDCFISFIPIPGLGCGKCLVEGSLSAPYKSAGQNAIDGALCGLGCALPPGPGTVLSILTCAWSLRACLPSGRRDRRASAAIGARPLIQIEGSGLKTAINPYLRAQEKWLTQVESFTIVFNGRIMGYNAAGEMEVNQDAVEWLGLDDPHWVDRLHAAVSDASDKGIFITPTEAANLTSPLPKRLDDDPLPLHLVQYFIQRWNNTHAYGAEGVYTMEDLPNDWDANFMPLDEYQDLQQALEDNSQNRSINFYQEMVREHEKYMDKVESDEEGTCVKVRVRIEQELSLTRVAFIGSLELTNAGAVPLTGISVRINIWRADDASRTNVADTLFVIGDPDPVFQGGVNGSGYIAPESSGLTEWLFMALSEAASEPTIYDVGGKVTYYIDGVEFTINLWPDQITVLPDPALVIKYFWASDVYGDDPFTPEKEPSVPFYLGMMVYNKGLGIAHDVKLLSGQPEIVENEKGLLITFKIVSARLNYGEISPTLAINFKDVQPLQTSAAVFGMTSTLQGRFSNFSASVEYNTPLGDPRLSVLENLTIHSLIHVVKDHIWDDGVPDFLTNENDVTSDENYPDTLHRSLNDTVVPVQVCAQDQVTGDAANAKLVDGGFTVRLTISGSRPSGWVYLRADDPVADTYPLSAVERGEGSGQFLPADNAWRTKKVKRYKTKPDELQDWLHVLDYDPVQTYTLWFTGLFPVSGLRLTEIGADYVVVAYDRPAGATVFRVGHRATSSPPGTPFEIDSDAATALSFRIDGLLAGTSYTIEVHAGRGGQWDTQGKRIAVTTAGAPGQSQCGNGVLELGEECEASLSTGSPSFQPCCDPGTCKFRASSHVCRAAAGACDVQEKCSGTTASCPPNQLAASGLACDDGDTCTVGDQCFNGACVGSNTCNCNSDAECASANPCVVSSCVAGRCSSTNATAGKACDDGDACTLSDACDGSGLCTGAALDCSGLDNSCGVGQCVAGTCTTEPTASGQVCRASSGTACDQDEVCDGVSGACPADTGASCLVNSQVTCQPGENVLAEPTETQDRQCVNATWVVDFVFDYDYAQAESQADEFRAVLRQTIATAASVPEEHLYRVDLKPGSTVADVYVSEKPSYDKVAALGSLKLCLSFSSDTVCTGVKSQEKDQPGSGLGIVPIAAGAGAALVLIAIAVMVLMRRRRAKRQQGAGSKAGKNVWGEDRDNAMFSNPVYDQSAAGDNNPDKSLYADAGSGLYDDVGAGLYDDVSTSGFDGDVGGAMAYSSGGSDGRTAAMTNPTYGGGGSFSDGAYSDITAASYGFNASPPGAAAASGDMDGYLDVAPPEEEYESPSFVSPDGMTYDDLQGPPQRRTSFIDDMPEPSQNNMDA